MRAILISISIGVILIALRLSFVRRSADTEVDKSVWGQGTTTELTQQTKLKLDGIAAGIRVYNKMHGEIPTNGVNLILEFNRGKVALARCAENMLDAWGRQIIYAVKNSCAVLTSAGADGEFATEDDIMVQVDIAEGTHVIWGYKEELTLEKSQRVYGEWGSRTE